MPINTIIAHGQYIANPVFLLVTWVDKMGSFYLDLISCKKKFILDNTAMELQKVPEGSFNKENINDSVGFIVLNFLFQLLKKTSHSYPYLAEIFLQYRKSFIYQACSVKMTRY